LDLGILGFVDVLLLGLDHMTHPTGHRFNRVLVWIATGLTLMGATCTSLRIDPLNIYLLNIGCLFFVAWAVRIRDRAMITVNTGLLMIYVMGLFFSP
jgi:hypothetical protein